MSYCRHENTAGDMSDVVDKWYDFSLEDTNQYELRGRIAVINLAKQIIEMAEFDNELEKLQQYLKDHRDEL